MGMFETTGRAEGLAELKPNTLAKLLRMRTALSVAAKHSEPSCSNQSSRTEDYLKTGAGHTQHHAT